MRRPVLILLFCALIFQGVVTASADVAQSQMQHCAGHDMSQENCACCTDGLAMLAGCMNLCSAFTAIAEFLPAIPRLPGSQHVAQTQHWTASPHHIPPTPPPIS